MPSVERRKRPRDVKEHAEVTQGGSGTAMACTWQPGFWVWASSHYVSTITFILLISPRVTCPSSSYHQSLPQGWDTRPSAMLVGSIPCMVACPTSGRLFLMSTFYHPCRRLQGVEGLQRGRHCARYLAYIIGLISVT